MKQPFIITGVIVAIAAIVVALYQDEIRGKSANSPPPEKTLKSRLVDKGLKLVGLQKTGSNSSSNKSKTDIVTVIFLSLGFIAIVFAVIGFLRREGNRSALFASTLGLIAIAWSSVWIAVFLGLALFVASGPVLSAISGSVPGDDGSSGGGSSNDGSAGGDSSLGPADSGGGLSDGGGGIDIDIDIGL